MLKMRVFVEGVAMMLAMKLFLVDGLK